MTDGHWHRRGRSLRDAAKRAAAEGITVHAITFSTGRRRGVMRDVAREGGGKHFHAPDAATLKKIYEEIAYTLPILLTE